MENHRIELAQDMDMAGFQPLLTLPLFQGPKYC